MRDSFEVDVRHLTNGSNRRVIVICPNCRKERDVIFNSVIKSDHSECQHCFLFIDRTGWEYEFCQILEFHDRNKWGDSIWKCLCRCGKVFTALGHSLESGVTTSCGCRQREIVSKMMTGKTGDKSYSWNPNLTDVEREVGRNYPEIREWSIQIKERDNFRCQCCGDDKGGNLVSHHLNKYSDFPDQQCDLENGVTLCDDCHKEFHYNYMGNTKIPCTKEDFIDFCNEDYPDALFLTLL